MFMLPEHSEKEETDEPGSRKPLIKLEKTKVVEINSRLRSQSEQGAPLVGKGVVIPKESINERRPDENILEGENNIPQIKEIRLMNLLRKHYNPGAINTSKSSAKDKTNVFLSPTQLVSGFANFLNTSPLKGATSKKKNVKNFFT